ncbi:DsbA family oxidoreductase [Cupriavidus basilensis]|uniref:2-hydroxychromene-2-carboxylate isomerase/DsbA-like thioredoxin domain n=1 Tax=Cupriavidus basilensis TaxID=68895 RepID=A0A0C4YT21_9BURK|nr:DsbA family oxidoreductase [Cupriavidus basilensis]AJG23816.1 2-hydroxychromene-2-carboxylate isomerase/DsbA-like thioredoxin domain [Cupriavidus basilensis]
MQKTLKIDFVSDVACPWCAVGLSSLQQALARLGDAVSAEITLRPFELNPDMGPGGESIQDYMARKYGRTEEEIVQSQAMIRQRGADVGFEFGSRTRVYNTFDAHRLLHWANLEGRQLPLKMALFRAYFTESKDSSNHEVLVEAAAAAGLDADKARTVLSGDAYAAQVREMEKRYQDMGIRSVPSIIFNDQYLVSGGQPVEAFENAIREVLAKG